MGAEGVPGPFAIAASGYLGLGLRILPLRARTKDQPLIKWGREATTEPKVIQGWARKWPDANIGLALGGGFVVVDVDDPAVLAELEAAHAPLPRTVTCDTPRGGAHYYFQVPDGGSLTNARGALPAKIDIRGEGGYVLAPPSVHPNGGVYGWRSGCAPSDLEPAVLPSWVLRLIRGERDAADEAPGSTPATGRRALLIPPVIVEGERNQTLFSLAGSMRHRGMDAATIEAALQGVNQGRCAPPLDADEVGRIAEGIGRYPPGVSACATADGDTFSLTDTGNADRLVAWHGADIRHAKGLGWLAWDGKRWVTDAESQVMCLGGGVLDRIERAAAQEADEARQKELTKHVRSSRAEPRRTAMLKLARHDGRVRIDPSCLDVDQWSLNLQNGTLDLKRCELRPHRRGDMATKITPVGFEPGAPCAAWRRFIDEITCGDAARAAYLQRVIGYSLTGSTREQCLFVLYGAGSNGKSTLLEVIRALMGDYGRSADMASFLETRADKVREDLADLHGARFVSAVEVEKGRHLAEATIKQLTGGDAISARFLFKDRFQFTPRFKIFLAVNHKPGVRGADDGIWRRLRLIPFERKFSDAEKDRGLLDKLRSELPGILAWAVEGCRRWQEIGLAEPDDVREAIDGYRSEMDVIGGFIEERCVIRGDARAGSQDLYDAYQQWAVDSGERALPLRGLVERLAERGFHRGKSHGVQTWRGLGLRHPARRPQDADQDTAECADVGEDGEGEGVVHALGGSDLATKAFGDSSPSSPQAPHPPHPPPIGGGSEVEQEPEIEGEDPIRGGWGGFHRSPLRARAHMRGGSGEPSPSSPSSPGVPDDESEWDEVEL